MHRPDKNYLQCANRLCQRIDREDHLWRRFAESGGVGSCRGCNGHLFKEEFIPTPRERELVRLGAFRVYDQDPYLFVVDPRAWVPEDKNTAPHMSIA